MASFTFELDSRRVERTLEDLVRGLDDFSQPLGDAGDDLVEYFANDVIEAQGVKSSRSGGNRWPDWSPMTLKMRTNREGYYKAPPERTDLILVWTGRLRKGFRRVATGTSLQIKNIVKYFADHQLGAGKVPKRAILTINPEVVNKVMERIEAYISKILK